MKPHHKPDFYKHEEWELGSWLSAALEDPKSCEEFKESIRAWFEMLGERATQRPKLCDRPICHHNGACVNDFAAESKKCPHRPESALEINKRFTEMQADIHRRIAPYLPRRLQGIVMGEIREVLRWHMRAAAGEPIEESFHKAAMTYRNATIEGASRAYVDLVRLAKLLDKDS